MKSAGRLIIVLILAVVGFWVWRTFLPSPEVVIQRRLVKLARAASFSQNDNVVSKALGAEEVPDYFAPRVDIVLDIPGHQQHTFNNRDDIAEKAKMSRAGPGLSVKFPDINVTVNPDNSTAVADVTLNAHIAGDHDDIVEELQITLEKTNSDWLIDRIQTVRPVTLQ